MRERVLAVFFVLLITVGLEANSYDRIRSAYRFDFSSVVVSPVPGQAVALEKFVSENGMVIRKVTRLWDYYRVEFNNPYDDPELAREIVAKEGMDGLVNLIEVAEDYVMGVVDLIAASKLARLVEPNYLFWGNYTPNDPFFVDSDDPSPGAPPNQYAFFITNAEAGWDSTTGSPDVKILIIDSGVDLDHPDLLSNIWVNPGEDIDADGIPYDLDDVNGIDDDGNGFVDDLNGHDWVGPADGLMFGGVSPAEDWNPDVHYYGDDGWGEPDPSCGDGVDASGFGLMPPDIGVSHGTHCAGIAAGVIDNEYGIAGAAGHCKIIAARCMNPEGSAEMDALIAGIEYGIIVGADVISMSFGGLFGVPAALEEACDSAYRAGCILVAASGNNGTSGVAPPASYSSVLAVGSFNKDRERSYFSQYGEGLDVLAGGGDAEASGFMMNYTEVIWSTWVASVADEDSGMTPGGHYFRGEAGTSMACPHAAGLAALIRSALPDASPEEVYNIIRDNAQDVGEPGWDEETGFGIIDFHAVYSAVQELIPKKVSLKLFPPVPNPCNPEAQIDFVLDKPGTVELALYNLAGEKVNDIYSGYLPSGRHSVAFNGEALPSGVYLVHLSENSNTTTQKLVLLR